MLLLLQVLGGCFVPSVEASTFVEVELLEPSPARSSSVKYKTRPSLNSNYFHEYNSREFLFQKVPVRTHTHTSLHVHMFIFWSRSSSESHTHEYAFMFLENLSRYCIYSYVYILYCTCTVLIQSTVPVHITYSY